MNVATCQLFALVSQCSDKIPECLLHLIPPEWFWNLWRASDLCYDKTSLLPIVSASSAVPVLNDVVFYHCWGSHSSCAARLCKTLLCSYPGLSCQWQMLKSLSQGCHLICHWCNVHIANILGFQHFIILFNIFPCWAQELINLIFWGNWLKLLECELPTVW
jgi:hypothetical protein